MSLLCITIDSNVQDPQCAIVATAGQLSWTIGCWAPCQTVNVIDVCESGDGVGNLYRQVIVATYLESIVISSFQFRASFSKDEKMRMCPFSRPTAKRLSRLLAIVYSWRSLLTYL